MLQLLVRLMIFMITLSCYLFPLQGCNQNYTLSLFFSFSPVVVSFQILQNSMGTYLQLPIMTIQKNIMNQRPEEQFEDLHANHQYIFCLLLAQTASFGCSRTMNDIILFLKILFRAKKTRPQMVSIHFLLVKDTREINDVRLN